MKSWIFIGLLLSLISGAGYYYFSTTQKTIAGLIQNNATMKSDISRLVDVNENNINTIDRLQSEYQTIQENFYQLEIEFENIRNQRKNLETKFKEHDINRLAYSKPKLVENIVNNSTNEALRCFELLSGSPLTDDERAATNENNFNSECPFLWYRP